MPARRLTLPAAAAALIVGLATLATPALAAGPTPAPTDHPAGFVTIEDGPFFYFPRELGIALRYYCYGDPTTVNVTVTAGAAQATGSKAIICQGQPDGEPDLPVGLGLTVPEDAPAFPPGVYSVQVEVSIPGQASEVVSVQVEGPPVLAQVDILAVHASPKEVVKGKKITVNGVIIRGYGGLGFSAKTALEFRPDSGHWRKVKSVTSSEDGGLSAKTKATKSGNYRFRYAGDSENAPATSGADHIVVRPKPKTYNSCAALTKVYKHGVGKDGATEVGLGVTNWTRNTPTYKKNKKLDPDHDGVACEQA